MAQKKKAVKKAAKKAVKGAKAAVPAPAAGQMPPGAPTMDSLPKEAQEKLKKIKVKLDKFQEQITTKFKQYINGIALLPPPKDVKPEDKDKVHILVLVDDTDSQKMSKEELKEKLTGIIIKMAQDIDKNLTPNVLILSEVWQSAYDGKTEVLQMIAMGAPIYDTGMLSAIKISEIHKSMVIKKFEKYIVSYGLAGSLVQGRATPESDIDVWIVIDDTDVKKMTRAELKDKLRAIIIGMGMEAGEMTGIRNKLNIQVWILTEFWDGIKEANPVFYTMLRDGVPFYDRGMFMPWKQLLKMGKIKPSPEAIDMFMSSGDQMLKRVHMKLREIGMEDTFWAILTPSQAALMMYGIPPPTPKETPEILRDIFVKKEKILEEKYVKILEHNIQVRKDLEHGGASSLTGKDVDKLLKDAEDYLKRIQELFKTIESRKEKETVVHIYDTLVTVIRDVLKMEGIGACNECDLVTTFENELISEGKVPAKYLRILNDVIKAKEDYESDKLTKSEVDKIRKSSSDFIKFIVEYMQRKRGRDLERSKIKVKYGDKYGEVILLDGEAFIVRDVQSDAREVTKAKVGKKGNLSGMKESNYEELEKALATAELPPNVFLKESLFEALKEIFGAEMEIMVSNF